MRMMERLSLEVLVAVGCVLLVVDATIPRACSTPDTDKFPFCNTSLSIDERIDDLISRLKSAEKPPLLTARESPKDSKGNVSRIGLPEYDWGANCVHGVQSRCGTRCPTSFPNPNLLGASWNMSLVADMGNVIGVELRALWLEGVGENHANDLPHVGLDCWSPNININRDPRWGRNQEVATEDPFLMGRYAVAYTTGLQEGVDKRYLQAVVTLKHWDAYSLEDWHGVSRHQFNAIVSQYDFSNTYWPAFKAAVTEAKAKGVMCSYNAVNGVPSCANNFLNHALRNEWGFDGYITSDSGAIFDIYANHNYTRTRAEAVAVSLKAGCNIDSGTVYLDDISVAISEGLISEDDVDAALRATLKLRFELGLFDPIEDQPYWHVPPTAVNTPQSQALNLLATQQGMVLLKNEGNLLPLSPGKKIAVLGPNANSTANMLGNYLGQICPGGQHDFSCVTSPLDAITSMNKGGSVTYQEGCDINSDRTSGFADALAAAKEADTVIVFLGLDESVEGEGHDRDNITLPGVQLKFIQAVHAVGKPTIVVLLNGGVVAIEWTAANVPAILEAWYPGYQGGVAIANILFGVYNPGGKLPVTMYKADYVNQISMFNMSMTAKPGRGYRYFSGTPIYPFGYGLSYTTFSVKWTDGHEMPKAHISNRVAGDSVTYSVNVTNTGSRFGDEVVQAYFVPTNHSNPVRKQLFGFQRVGLQPGQSTVLHFTMTPATVKTVVENGDIYSLPGEYGVQFTNGVDQRITSTLLITGDKKLLEAFPKTS